MIRDPSARRPWPFLSWWLSLGVFLTAVLVGALSGIRRADLFTLMSGQYNLRAATRLLHCAVALDVAVWAWLCLRGLLSRQPVGDRLVAESGKHVPT